MRFVSSQWVASRAARFAAGVAALSVLSVPGVLALEPRVPYVPTPQEVVERMLEIAKVGPHDYLIDLGSGDGRIVITAARKHGTRGFGVDVNPVRIQESNDNARRAGVADKVAFYQRDLFETDLGAATVITMYLLPRVNLELRSKLLQLRPGTRLVSHDFDMDNWKADLHVTVDARDKYGGAGGTSDIYFWVVPARAAGMWQWEIPISGKLLQYELALEQKYQAISGSARVGSRSVKLSQARLRGAEIRLAFTADINGQPVQHELTGKIDGETAHGSARLSGARIQGRYEWNAQRVTRPSTGGREAPLRISRTRHGPLH